MFIKVKCNGRSGNAYYHGKRMERVNGVDNVLHLIRRGNTYNGILNRDLAVKVK